MPRRAVKFHIGEYYHVYNRGNNRDRIFFDNDNYLFFLRKVRQFVTGLVPDQSGDLQQSVLNSRQQTCQMIAYCLMPNHYHFLVRITADGFSSAMQSFSQAYTNAINKYRSRVGSLFQGRFKAIHVDEEDYLLHLTRYIHLNPLVASLVEVAADWEYSSYPDYIGIRQGTLPAPEVILKVLGSSAQYQSFVETGSRNAHSSISHLMLDEAS